MRNDEPGNETTEEADPGGEEDGKRGHARPEEDQTDGNGGAADDDSKDCEEPG